MRPRPTRASRRFWAIAAALASSPASAQETLRLEASLLSDFRERGLSWSDGKAAAQIRADAPLPAGFDISAVATTARSAPRHGGADAAVDLGLGYGHDAGLLRLRASAVAHVFPGGRGAQDYIELGGGMSIAFGPIDLSLAASYAPPQRAIGGGNVYRRARMSAALPGTPLTLSGHFGRSTGSTRDPIRAERLRPGGNYHDWSLGADYALRLLTLSLTYADTDIRRAPSGPVMSGHRGAVLVAGAHLTF